MKKTFLLSLIALSCCYMEACHDDHKAKNYNERTKVDDAGIDFITRTAEAGNTEIAAANVAEKKSTNPRVINFAKMMITDHTAMGNELKKLAAAKEVTTTDSVMPEHKQMIATLASKSGAEFDKAYMEMMVADHGKVIELFDGATKNTNAGTNNFARKYISKLQMHQDSARAINSSLK